jgi:hypothetical protein
MKPSLLKKAAIIPVARCINFYLPGCVNLQVPLTIAAIVIMGRDRFPSLMTLTLNERFESLLKP